MDTRVHTVHKSTSELGLLMCFDHIERKGQGTGHLWHKHGLLRACQGGRLGPVMRSHPGAFGPRNAKIFPKDDD